MILSINQTNFDDILAAEKTVLLDFYADWCGPCRMVAPFVEEIAQENPQLLVGKINVDEEPELANQFRIMSIPTLMVIRDKKIMDQEMGAVPKHQILAML